MVSVSLKWYISRRELTTQIIYKMAKSMKIHMKSSKALGIDVKGLKPYGCDICKKRFRETKLLKNHKKTHTEEKRYACDVCDKKFAGSGSFGSFVFHII